MEYLYLLGHLLYICLNLSRIIDMYVAGGALYSVYTSFLDQ